MPITNPTSLFWLRSNHRLCSSGQALLSALQCLEILRSFAVRRTPSKTFADGLELDHATTFHHFRLLHTARKLKLPTVTHAKHFTSQASMSLIPAQSVPPEVSLRSWFDANVSGIHLEAANSAPKFLCSPLGRA